MEWMMWISNTEYVDRLPTYHWDVLKKWKKKMVQNKTKQCKQKKGVCSSLKSEETKQEGISSVFWQTKLYCHHFEFFDLAS